MARLGTVIRLAERRGRRGVGSHVDGAMVELGAVTVRFDGRVVVNAVTATVGRGEWVGLIGANGAGKTTLIKAVAGLVDHEGEVLVGGKPSTTMAWRERARSVADVPQSPSCRPTCRCSTTRCWLDAAHRLPGGGVEDRSRATAWSS